MYKPGDLRLEDVPIPNAGPGEVLVRVSACGVCGSDIPRMLTKGAHRMPIICGHEFSGKIVTLGDGVEGFSEGELVAVAPLLPCLRCDQCLKGNFSRCRDYSYFGSRRDGAYAEYVSVPVGNLLKTPKGVDPRAVAMTDPASIALHAIWKASFTIGQSAAIVGCGPIGLFAIQWLRMLGASEVIAVDVSESKLELARLAGATRTLLSTEPVPADVGVDLVIEGAGVPATINRAVRLTGPGGHVVFIGIPTRDITVELATFSHLLRQETSMHGSWNSFGAPFPGPQWTVTLEKFGSGALRWDFIISHEFGLDELPGMFDRIREGRESYSKIMVRP
ncbi:MAG: galactitol-1-phosphate 5-dehydrogenase [Bradyrhizobium sp.]|nr:galactitol-1-phosphate 5-dehydrogenase [Bradyrhizobium sp.]